MAASDLPLLPVLRGVPIALSYKEPLGLKQSLSTEQLPEPKHNPYA